MMNLRHQYLGQVVCNNVEPDKTRFSDDKYRKTGPQNVIPTAVGYKSSFLFKCLKHLGQQMFSYDHFVILCHIC